MPLPKRKGTYNKGNSNKKTGSFSEKRTYKKPQHAKNKHIEKRHLFGLCFIKMDSYFLKSYTRNQYYAIISD